MSSSGLEQSRATKRPGEYILIVGGPALLTKERLRLEHERHDRFWGNFLAAANRRADALKAAGYLNDRQLTLLIYRDGLGQRALEDGKPYLDWAQQNAEKRGAKLVWFNNTEQFIAYLNKGANRRSLPIVGMEYFGHSNRHSFLFDYSSDLYAASTDFLHEEDLGRIRKSAFADGAYIKSWGCHSAESMCKVFQNTLGHPMIGAYGSTDYTSLAHGHMPYAKRWSH